LQLRHPVCGVRHRLMVRLLAFLALLSLLLSSMPDRVLAEDRELDEFPIPNGYYYSQAGGGDPSNGYTITNSGGIALWDAFQSLGGVASLGYPASQRFLWNGFVAQTTQKAILQWNPDRQQVDVVNTFDVLSELGYDPWLMSTKQTPPAFDNGSDDGKTWNQIVARHLAELDWNPAIKARYFADPDPVVHFGLPQSYADEGNVLVVRCQRAVFQQWKQDVPWARAGQVTLANGGDIAKQANLLPPDVLATESAAALLVAPLDVPLSLTPDQATQVRAAAGAMLPAVVRIVSALDTRDEAIGSGVIIDTQGLVLTNAHVIERAVQISVALPDGRTVGASVVGQDVLSDIALLRIPSGGLHAAVAGNSSTLRVGSLVVGLGFSERFPSPPMIRVGTVTRLNDDSSSAASVTYVDNNLYIQPGDSGGPLFNLQGQVLGINEAITYSRPGRDRFTNYSVTIESARSLANRLIAGDGRVVRPSLGVTIIPMDPGVAEQVGLPYVPGLLVTRVPSGSAAIAILRPGDVVTSIDDTATLTTGALATVLGRHRPGDRVDVTVVTTTGRRATVSLPLTPASEG